ncbi:hypothetical protein [Streptomyces liangshanensis]|uniref:hypothetical protein n=1 Tax=Streptomyces liangshanensis TaxID=2717324 RepID=UPI0036D78F2D
MSTPGRVLCLLEDVELFRDVLRADQTLDTGTTTLSSWAVAGAELALDFHIVSGTRSTRPTPSGWSGADQRSSATG